MATVYKAHPCRVGVGCSRFAEYDVIIEVRYMTSLKYKRKREREKERKKERKFRPDLKPRDNRFLLGALKIQAKSKSKGSVGSSRRAH